MKQECIDIVSYESYQLIGNKAACYWHIHNEPFLEAELLITLSFESTINLKDIIQIKHEAFTFSSKGIQNIHLDEYIVTGSILFPVYPEPPHIRSKIPTQIGICNTLTLDARSTTGLGGRKRYNRFKWTVHDVSDDQFNAEYGNFVILKNSKLSENTDIIAELNVTNWYGISSVEVYEMQKSNDVLPIITISGINKYSSTNLNLNGLVDINAQISVVDCDENINQFTQGSIYWNVQVNKLYNTVVIDNELLNDLNDYLLSQTDMTWLSINANTYLQPGISYIFSMNFKCGEDSVYECDVTVSHYLEYIYDNIHCGITSNDIQLNDFDPMQSIVIPLNGLVLTYDPNTLDKSHLKWSWTCYDIETQQNCDELLDNTDSEIVYLDFDSIELQYSWTYVFRIDVEVYDSINTERISCSDSIDITINPKDINDNNNERVNIIQAVPLNTNIKKEDTLRIIVTVLNYEQRLDTTTEYKWTEINE